MQLKLFPLICCPWCEFVPLNNHAGLVVEKFRIFGGNGEIRAIMTPPAVSNRGREEKKVLRLLRGVAGENGSLDCGTTGERLIKVNALEELLAFEEVRNKFDDTRNTS